MKHKVSAIIWLLLSVFSVSFFLIQISSIRINSILYNYINVEAKRVTANVVNASVNDVLSKKIDSNLFIVRKDSSKNIETIDYNTKKVNKLLEDISNNIQKKLILLEEGKLNTLSLATAFKGNKFHYVKDGVICEVPAGTLSGNGFLANVGPIIPIKMSFMGQVNSNLNTKIANYGINNMYLEINVHVEIEEKITMPKMSKDSILKIDAPLTAKIIQGSVPKYYGGAITQDSQIFSLPNSN